MLKRTWRVRTPGRAILVCSWSLIHGWYHNGQNISTWKLCFTYDLYLCEYANRVYSHPEKIIYRVDLIIFRTSTFQIFRFCDVHVCTSHSEIPIGIDHYSRLTSDIDYRQISTVKEIWALKVCNTFGIITDELLRAGNCASHMIQFYVYTLIVYTGISGK